MFRSKVLVFSISLAIAASAAWAAPKKGDPEKGKEVFQENPCAGCHNTDSTEKKAGTGPKGPGLKGLFAKDKMNNGKKPTEVNVRAQINDGGNGMPGFADMLSDDEKDDLIAYLKTL